MNEKELKRLIAKYYEGLSTNDEEMALRAYFSGNNVPPEYEDEKEIFSFLMEAGEIPRPSHNFEARISAAVGSSVPGKRTRLRRLLIPSLSAAAGVLILAGTYFFFMRQVRPEDTFTDPQIAYAETMKILMDVSAQMNHATHPLKPVGRINEIRNKSLTPINRSAALVEKNLKSLSYLMNSAEIKSASKEKINNK